MKFPLPLHLSLVAISLLLPSCEGLDPALLSGASGGGGSNYQNGYGRLEQRYNDRRYASGYDRSESYRSDSYDRTPERPYYGSGYSSGRDSSYNGSRYDGDSHQSRPRDKNYFGGSQEWYKSGYGVGKKDRREGRPNNYRSHRNQYDSKTQSQFAAGYEDGYNR